ncbi:MAG: competence/damage-inducible protein A [Rhodospirillaceae bacterium]|jgi:molybdenum cofactor synthesis domain-containing protein|nr:competence/damage-inducible protein A [Rhodospirillaceae bacterium]MBT5195192.1 competence/damage-inducible protein A [Rhodospirillaceae bacterium]MBT5896813.1 competence/damage-inducible protein A [Rhodospirillaceae bacterium]MBT6430922.1 competence/damage-inducible protein A [Rhodospirillaceae bacterium]
MSDGPKTVTAAVIVIGDEILSGRTKDLNLGFLAEALNDVGVQLREARFVADLEGEIVDAVNALRARFDYVFTTGGIGPTHDDITADSIGAAFGLAVDHNEEAMAILTAHYTHTGAEFNQARMRMARTPIGASLVENPVSKAPGFRVENVYVLAGIPSVCQAMFHSLKHELVGGDPVQSVAIAVHLAEGTLANGLTALQEKYPDVGLGSYPFYRDGRFGASIVARSQVPDRLADAAHEIRQMMRDLGGEPIEDDAQ